MSVLRYKPLGIEKLVVIDTNLSIKGTVKELNISIPCRVRLFERSSGLLISDKETDNQGNYEFTCLNKLKYFIVAHHPLNQYNAVIADLVVPK